MWIGNMWGVTTVLTSKYSVATWSTHHDISSHFSLVALSQRCGLGHRGKEQGMYW